MHNKTHPRSGARGGGGSQTEATEKGLGISRQTKVSIGPPGKSFCNLHVPHLQLIETMKLFSIFPHS